MSGDKGTTLVELMIALGLLAILGWGVSEVVSRTTRSANQVKARESADAFTDEILMRAGNALKGRNFTPTAPVGGFDLSTAPFLALSGCLGSYCPNVYASLIKVTTLPNGTVNETEWPGTFETQCRRLTPNVLARNFDFTAYGKSCGIKCPTGTAPAVKYTYGKTVTWFPKSLDTVDSGVLAMALCVGQSDTPLTLLSSLDLDLETVVVSHAEKPFGFHRHVTVPLSTSGSDTVQTLR